MQTFDIKMCQCQVLMFSFLIIVIHEESQFCKSSISMSESSEIILLLPFVSITSYPFFFRINSPHKTRVWQRGQLPSVGINSPASKKTVAKQIMWNGIVQCRHSIDDSWSLSSIWQIQQIVSSWFICESWLQSSFFFDLGLIWIFP